MTDATQRLAVAILAGRNWGHWYEADVITTHHVESSDVAADILAADPHLADDLALGQAFREAVEALPLTGWESEDGRWTVPYGGWAMRIEMLPEDGDGFHEPHYPTAYIAFANVEPKLTVQGESGPTPTAALQALTKQLPGEK